MGKSGEVDGIGKLNTPHSRINLAVKSISSRVLFCECRDRLEVNRGTRGALKLTIWCGVRLKLECP